MELAIPNMDSRTMTNLRRPARWVKRVNSVDLALRSSPVPSIARSRLHFLGVIDGGDGGVR